MRIRTQRFLLIVVSLVVCSTAGTQELDNLAFRDQPIIDILKALGEVIDVTISSDQTVEGTASFFSPAMEVRGAIELLLEENGLYGHWEENVLHVSRMRIEKSDSGLYSLDAQNAEIQDIVLLLTEEAIEPIVFDALPREPVTIHVKDKTIEEILSILIVKHTDYHLESNEDLHYLRYERNRTPSTGTLGSRNIVREGDKYALTVERARFLDVLDELFQAAELEYSYLGNNNSEVTRVNFRPREFDQALQLLLEQGRCDFIVVGDIYYIFDVRGADTLKKYNSVVLRPLEYLKAQDIAGMFPSGMLPTGMMNIDKNRNSVTLYGSLEALAPIQHFIDTIDVEFQNRSWIRYDLDYILPSNLKGIIPTELEMIPLVLIPGTDSVLAAATPAQQVRFEAWLDVADRPSSGYPVTLEFITADKLMENLPPSFDENDVQKTQNPNLVFFKGSREKLKHFKESLQSIDHPIPQIRYDLLVIQYQDNQEWDWGSELSFEAGGNSPGMSVVGNISPILNLNFDVTSTFGYQFAVGLSAELAESRAKVIADSTLNGLSGQKISFRNTNTYRYQDNQYDASGNVTVSTEKEITSGLFIDINGSVSGGDMITMEVETTISKQLSADADNDTALPPTSEKVINTHIRTEAGTPVIIGGLTQQELSVATKKVPLLGSIPLLGYLFRNENQTLENTEFVVYIVPHIEYDRDFASDNGGLFEHIYEKYIER